MVAHPHKTPPRRRAVWCVIFAACLVCFALPVHAQLDSDGPLQPNHDIGSGKHALTNDAIVRMSKAGLDDSIILQSIDLQPGRYDTLPDDLIALKQAGVSARVMAAMQAKASGVKPKPVEPEVSVGPLAPGIDEIGIYFKDKSGAWVLMKVERVDFRSGGWVKSALTHNIIKEDRNGLVDAPHSPLVVPGGTQVMIFAPEGTEPEEYTFLRFREKSDRREFRVYTGGVFHNESGTDRDALEFMPKKVAQRTYVFTVPVDIGKGEYGVLPPGSSNTPGVNGGGKIFTFRIVE